MPQNGKTLHVHTLASLSEADSAGERLSTRVSRGDSPCITQALVTAATLTHEQKIGDAPKALLKLGGLALLDHVLIGLAEAGFTRVVVLVGLNAKEIRKVVEDGGQHLYPSLIVEILDLGESSSSHASSVLAARALFDEPFLICPSDHVYESKLYERMSDVELTNVKGAVLVETDLQGMVGLPRNTVHVAFRPLDSDARIHEIGCELAAYNAIDAGLVACTASLFAQLHEMEHKPYYTVADALNAWTSGKDLIYVKTKGATWFSVETDRSLDYSRENLTKVGQMHTMEDGKKVHLLGHPKRIKTSPSTGGDWAEFSVQKWRSAVFTTKSFFNQLYEDTTEFLQRYIDELGGQQNVCLVEIGCGTGEALIPLYDTAKYCIGVEINEDFVKFCQDQTPDKYRNKVGFVCGDAEELSTLLEDSDCGGFLKGTKKVVTCVGNTIGIIPEPKKSAIYKAMLDLAGPDGVVITVYWNGNEFGSALQHFYATNPQLCGEFEGQHINIRDCTLQTPSGYSTKWTKPEEARRIISGFNADVLEVREQGRGVLTAFRRKQDA